jgi:hypothetical protein
VKQLLWASLSLISLGCSAPGARSVTDAAAQRDVGVTEPMAVLPGGPTACGCSVDPQGTLDLFWSCYCAQSFAGCDVPLSVPADCATRVRHDYPDCGLTVIVNFTSAGVEVPSVYDASGNLVGRMAHSDLSGYTCPSDPTMISSGERSGQFPASTCTAVNCDPCYAGPFPCAQTGATDGG